MKVEERILPLLEEIANFITEHHALTEGTLKRIEEELLQIKERLEKKHKSELPDKPINIWSDGACKGNPGPGGWAAIIQNEGGDEEISGSLPQTTNNIMELTAALKGIQKTPIGSRIILTTDSKYLINGISDWIKNWKRNRWKKKDGKPVLNRELWQELDNETQLRNIDWKWIKGHSGHPKNERCDALAKLAIKTELF